MLITVKHLLVILLLLAAGMIGGTPAARSAGLGEGMSVLVGLLTAILVLTLLSWPVYTLLSLRPLILPTCPSCGRRHANYHIPRDAWPDPVLVCFFCNKPLRLALNGDGRLKPSELPTVTLRWPGFLGLWRRVAIEAANPGVERPG